MIHKCIHASSRQYTEAMHLRNTASSSHWDVKVSNPIIVIHHQHPLCVFRDRAFGCWVKFGGEYEASGTLSVTPLLLAKRSKPC